MPRSSVISVSRLIAIAALALHALQAPAAPACSRAVPVKATCEIALDALHPTQPAIGLIQVEERLAKMKDDADLGKYTRKWPLPVVQAPDGKFYLTDGHHLASELTRLGASRVNAQIIGRFNDPRTFWQEMQTRHWVYLFSPKGEPISPSALPRRIIEMADDPYRSLASYAQNAGYFAKTDAYFMEFQWARYFGRRMGWQPVDRLNLLDALHTAERLACQPEAKDLPGYLGPCKEAAK